jgi:hypothetical protein
VEGFTPVAKFCMKLGNTVGGLINEEIRTLRGFCTVDCIDGIVFT